MKTKEIINKSKDELHEVLNSERGRLVRFRFNISAGKVKNVKEAREIRKNVARLLTALKRIA